MSQLELVQKLIQSARDHGKKIFSLREIAALSGASRSAVAMTLLRAQKKQLVFRVANLWVNQLDPPNLTEIALSLRSPSYLSFESALYRHGILSQSPRGALTLATTKRPGEFDTPLGRIRFIHLKNSLFFGYDENRIAYPEKAWLDLIYIRGRQGREAAFSETFYLENLNQKRLKEWMEKFPDWVGGMALRQRESENL
ncbi:MAG TPA: hypothetical protein DF383_09250 [Deltaproteobacteria bacterium]|nr:hypothetical protein [Deltaproteobacteria bacterium]